MNNLFTDKTVLITGGTGFLGKALVKKILEQNPHSIRVLSRDEVKHYRFIEEIKDPRIRHFVGDVRDISKVRKATRACDIVIHAAAMKRIDMIEYNVEECIKTNILGTLNMVEACLENNVEKAVYVSTDKACSPVNTYGASKFIGERIFTESNFNKGSLRTVFTSVRYGNVLESTGSIIPIIMNKIKNNEELPLTDKRMTRFFITGDQAVELIFNAIKFGVGGEVFVPKLDAFKIVELLEVLKEHYKYNKPIKEIGIRPGEKIHELMINEIEAPRSFAFDGYYVITSEIERYQKNVKYAYLQKGNLAKFSEYSSKDVIVSKEKLKEKLKQYKIIS